MKIKPVHTIIVAGVAVAAFMLLSWRKKVSRLAKLYAGVNEIGNNVAVSDPQLNEWLKAVGWKNGEAWCMYFVKALYMNAFPNKAAEINKILTGSTQGSWANVKQHPDVFKVIIDGKPMSGDIIIWQSVNDPSKGHAGIVYKRDSGDKYFTVEGNSDLSGSAEGDGVSKNTRTLVPGTVEGSLKLLGFIRLKM